MSEIVKDLREYTKLKYTGDCRCGHCQLVPHDLVVWAADALELAEATIFALQELLRVPLSFPPGWNLTPGEVRLLSLLTRRGEQGVTHDAAAYAVSSNADQMAKPNTVRDVLVSLRRKVGSHGITIESLYGRGYAITGDSLTAARAALSHAQSEEN